MFFSFIRVKLGDETPPKKVVADLRNRLTRANERILELESLIVKQKEEQENRRKQREHLAKKMEELSIRKDSIYDSIKKHQENN